MGIALQILNKISKRIDSKLEITSKLADLDEQVMIEFKKLYEDNNLNSVLLAVLLNGALTESKSQFLMSLPLMRKLIAMDFKNGNITRKTLNDKEYRKFVAVLVKNNIISILDRSEKIGSNFPYGKAGTWKIVDQDCCKLILYNGTCPSQSEKVIYECKDPPLNWQAEIPGAYIGDDEYNFN